MKIDWNGVQSEIEDMIYLCLEIDADELKEMLIDSLDFSEEDAEEIATKAYGYVQDAEDQIKLDLAIDICGQIAYLYKQAEDRKYPEDAPGQLHLFEMEDSDDE